MPAELPEAELARSLLVGLRPEFADREATARQLAELLLDAIAAALPLTRHQPSDAPLAQLELLAQQIDVYSWDGAPLALAAGGARLGGAAARASGKVRRIAARRRSRAGDGRARRRLRRRARRMAGAAPRRQPRGGRGAGLSDLLRRAFALAARR